MKLTIIGTDYHGKFCIADSYRAVIEPIISCQVLPCKPDDILILVDDQGIFHGGNSGARIAKIPDILSDVVYQLTGERFAYILKLQLSYLVNLSANDAQMAIYKQLRHITRDADGLEELDADYTIQTWPELIQYETGAAACPDLTEVKIYDGGNDAASGCDSTSGNAAGQSTYAA